MTSDRTVLLVVPLIAAVAAFWFFGLKPKQEDAKALDSKVSRLEAQISKHRQTAEDGRQARKRFPRDYHRLLVMSKAVPADDQTASLLLQIRQIAGRHGVSFQTIKLSGGAASEAAPAAAAPPPSSEGESPDGSAPTESSSATTASAGAAPATEAAAASLPIGATVGSAGLATMPYQMTFRGNFFQIAGFLAGVDRLVNTDKERIISDGRLVTVNGFGLGADDLKQFPIVRGTLVVTTYVAPTEGGLTAGATSAGATSASAAATGTATPTPTSAPAPTP
jgi:Tfp pilus assembly protein PilO